MKLSKSLLVYSIPLTTSVFIVLKLTHIINWGWLWVFSPIWIIISFIFGVLMIWIFLISLENKRHKKYMKANFDRKTSSTTDWNNCEE